MYVDEFYVIGFSKAVVPADTVIVALNALALVRKAETGSFSLGVYDVSYTKSYRTGTLETEFPTPGNHGRRGIMKE
ncbi:hypothetical protein PTI98_012586 [Pleurotus ostreatus]|nr:hypothetical protein PTI98_012586 [Pleurotus ostreatus]